VTPIDLFPDFFEAKKSGLKCLKGNLSQALPLDSSSCQILICQEGIEHLSDQLKAIKEFYRVLSKDGRLFITAPNYSHFRTKLSYLLNESEIYKRLPANELDDIWHSDSDEFYYGHIFMIGLQKLRVLGRLSGFKITRLHKVKISWTSLLLGLPIYPFAVIVSCLAYLRVMRKQRAFDKSTKKRIYREVLKYNIHPKVLFGRHLFVEFQKVDLTEAIPEPTKTGYSAPEPVKRLQSSLT